MNHTLQINNSDLHLSFLSSKKPHILMITNHGVHEWNIVPGLPDTGGQNVFVNAFSDSLIKFGFRITIANRGGYRHPISGEWQRGLHYKDADQRILYLEDDRNDFVRKEDMHEQIPALVKYLKNFLDHEGTPVDLIISHYWDGALIGVQFNRTLGKKRVPHIWVPHSLGTIKKQNVHRDQWEMLRIDERIQLEKSIIPELDGIAATSSKIREALKNDYGYTTPDLFLPPCINSTRFHPKTVLEDDPVWEYLAKRSNFSPTELSGMKIITEISRTDTTKRKNILIHAFEKVYKKHPHSLLVLSIDENIQPLSSELLQLIDSTIASSHIIPVGSIWKILPSLYAISDIYCTPSIMEGFGMSAEEAAATGLPVVSSDLVPFVKEYLLGENPETLFDPDTKNPIQIGEGAIIVPAEDESSLAFALEYLLHNELLMKTMGQKAYQITIPYFTWEVQVKHFLEVLENQIGFSII